MTKYLTNINESTIQSKILLFRNLKVMLDRDLSELYEVETKVLNQAVKRNRHSFPKDFMFQLSESEKNKVVTSCDRFKSLKYAGSPPFAFTEYGILMLSSVLKSNIARKANITIIRAFVHFNKNQSTDYLNQRFSDIDLKFKEVHAALKVLFQDSNTLLV
ncbi:DNA-binding protein [Candidatus Marinamargulisbacteria bacterium SCGC AAA071-K20]|nr:DNA-binding protein [Candidatus Marinamargulisbacteria bacterium SCGC AAA071-K20]